MWVDLKDSLARGLQEVIRDRFGIDHHPVAEDPPRRSLGDLAFPAPLHLARTLKQAPRAIAAEILSHWQPPEPVREVRLEGAGYLNVFLDRPRVVRTLLERGPLAPKDRSAFGKIVVEHTNINPNKAAHVGHLRNAILGDLLVRILRASGYRVEVQNYIDDTGVQVADVVVGFLDMEPTSLADVRALPEPFDHYCWDLYARVTRWYEEHPERLELRRRTLHALETGEGERAALGRIVVDRIVQCHLRTMSRIGVRYDLLAYESHILALDFFSHAFEALREKGAIRFEPEGKNAGCWVMPLEENPDFAGLEEPDKVMVRSDGTVTYVGKDLAYQLWKFGLLGKDFAYRYRLDLGVWTTALEGAESPPQFARARRVINVIDARQSYLQKIVRAGLEALGHREAARESIHFAYEMVTLSAATARTLGVETEDGKAQEMSGRKGIGVKANDLLDQLESRARQEIASRHRDLERSEVQNLARQIAIAAVRFLMSRVSTTRVIAFDLEEALDFEGDTGPYLQYALVRARSIERKLEQAGRETLSEACSLSSERADLWSDELWDLVHLAARTEDALERAAQTLEPSLVARHALDLAKRFNALYHQHPVLHEANLALAAVRRTAFAAAAVGLSAALELLGIPEPKQM